MAMTKYEAMAAVDAILARFTDAKEKIFILKGAAESHGLKSEGGGGKSKEVTKAVLAERARQKRMIRGQSSLGTAVEVDPIEIDAMHDVAMGIHDDEDDEDEETGGGIFAS